MRSLFPVISALFLLSTMFLAAVSVKSRGSDVELLREAYFDRFTAKGAYISWSAPSQLPNLTSYSAMIVYGEVIREVGPVISPSYGLDRSIFEIAAFSYLKKPEEHTGGRVLVSQVTDEAWNPALEPGDRCIFFLYLPHDVAPRDNSLYRLSGPQTRYIVYRNRAYSIFSLQPKNNPDYYPPAESLAAFMERIRAYTEG